MPNKREIYNTIVEITKDVNCVHIDKNKKEAKYCCRTLQAELDKRGISVAIHTLPPMIDSLIADGSMSKANFKDVPEPEKLWFSKMKENAAARESFKTLVCEENKKEAITPIAMTPTEEKKEYELKFNITLCIPKSEVVEFIRSSAIKRGFKVETINGYGIHI